VNRGVLEGRRSQKSNKKTFNNKDLDKTIVIRKFKRDGIHGG